MDKSGIKIDVLKPEKKLLNMSVHIQQFFYEKTGLEQNS